MKRIAYVVKVFPKFSETFILGELAELRRRGVDVLILSLRRPADDVRHGLLAESGLSSAVRYDRSAFMRELLEFEPELIHAHFATEPAAEARALAAAVGVPFTFTAHGYDIYRRPPDDFGARAAAAARVVTVSKANAAHIARRFGVSGERVAVVPTGIDVSHFRPPEGLRDEPPLVASVARLVPVKALDRLLEACALLRRWGLAFRCVLVGDGRSRDDLIALRERLSLSFTVEVVGPATQEEVLAWWQRASVAVLPSDSEGLPVSLMEAGACGVPAVATAVGGTPELVVDEETGLLCPQGDVAALAGRIGLLLRNPVLRAKMGAAARVRAERFFSVGPQVDRLLATWAGVLDAREAA